MGPVLRACVWWCVYVYCSYYACSERALLIGIMSISVIVDVIRLPAPKMANVTVLRKRMGGMMAARVIVRTSGLINNLSAIKQAWATVSVQTVDKFSFSTMFNVKTCVATTKQT